MKRFLVAPVIVALALTVSPGVAYAGSSGGTSGQNGSSGSNGTANANCAGKVAIYIWWWGKPGTITQCKP